MTTQHTEADLIARMAQATTLTEQREAAEALNEFRTARREEIDREGSLDWDAMREVDLRPTFVSEPVTAAAIGSEASGLDWLDEVMPDEHDMDQVATAMRAEATLWFQSLWEPVKEDPTEFPIQAKNAARRIASRYGLQSEAAASVFVDTAKHLHTTSGRQAAWGDPGPSGTDPLGTQPGPYHMPNGSDLDNPTNKDTFDGLVNGENAATTEDPKTEKSDSPSLKEGDQPEQDKPADGVTPPITDEDANYAKDKSQGTGYTDPMPSGGKGASKTAGRYCTTHDVWVGDGNADTHSRDSCNVEQRETEQAKESSKSVFARLRDAFAYTPPPVSGGATSDAPNYGPADTSESGDPKTDASDSPSLAEGDQPEGDKAEPFVKPQEPAQDKSTWGKDPDMIPTGGQDGTNAAGGAKIQGTPTTSSLKGLGIGIARQAATDNTRIFGQALATMSSLEEKRAEFTGYDIVQMVLASGDVSPEHREALKALAELPAEFKEQQKGSGDSGSSEGGQTCSVCGDKIAKDPNSEDPSTWHHDNGEKHDHEAKPSGGDSKESARTAATQGDKATCHCGRPIEYFDHAWYHLNADGPVDWESHGPQTYPLTPKEKADKESSRGGSPFGRSAAQEGDCGYCAGTGRVSNGAPGMDLGPGFPAFLDCPMCNGTGKGDSSLKPYTMSSKTAGSSVEVAAIPSCDICAYEEGNHGVPAAYDGKTTMGPWANMCERHFETHGMGLGTGRGQRLLLKETSLGDPEDLFAPGGGSPFVSEAAADHEHRYNSWGICAVCNARKPGTQTQQSGGWDNNQPEHRRASRSTEEIEGQTFDIDTCLTCGMQIVGRNGNWMHDPRSPIPNHPDGSIAGDAHAPKPA